MRGTHRFKVKGKLAPRYVGPFKIVDHRGEVAYQLELSPQLSDVHDIFHMSQPKRTLRCAKFNGVTTPRTKLPGNTKKSSGQIILNYSQALPKSRGEILLRGCRFVTPTFYKNKILSA
jgi:hypothetical protein